MTEQPGHPSPKDSEAGRRSGSDPDLPASELQAHAADARPSASAVEAIDRATAALGDDDGTHR